jgi:hypothetical protein
LALFGRQPPQSAEGFVMPASKNLHKERNHASRQKQCCSITSSVPTKGSSLTIYLTGLDMHGAMQRSWRCLRTHTPPDE